MSGNELPTVTAVNEYVREAAAMNGCLQAGFTDSDATSNHGGGAVEPDLRLIDVIRGAGFLAGRLAGEILFAGSNRAVRGGKGELGSFDQGKVSVIAVEVCSANAAFDVDEFLARFFGSGSSSGAGCPSDGKEEDCDIDANGVRHWIVVLKKEPAGKAKDPVT